MLNHEPPALVDFVTGDATNLQIPAHAVALRHAGAAFLTEAFWTYGALSRGNRVTRITRCDAFPGGNSGHKMLLSVEYATAAPGLHTDLFVKFSRDFDDAFRDRRRDELEAEIRMAQLSRSPQFPLAVPVPYFADFHRESGTGLLITQRIAFGRGNIEPLHRKCMDHELDDPLAYYRTTVTALARLAAAHKSGRLSPQLEELFPFDPLAAAAALPIPWNEQQLRERVERFAVFARSCPRLLPEHLQTPDFIARLERDAVRLLRNEAAIKRFLHAHPDFVALCHWNTNIDNAWFWRDDDGALHCGLLDWGMVRQMNVGYALWGGLCGASLDVWDRHLDELLTLFIEELHAQGGPRLASAELRLHLELSAAMLALALMMDVPSMILARLPEVIDATHPLDPILFKDEVVRGFLHVFTALLNLWQTHDIDASLDRFLAIDAGPVSAPR